MRTHHVLLPAAALLLAACSATVPSAPAAPAAPVDQPAGQGSTGGAQVAKAVVVDVYRSPTCSCCHEWEAYLRARGYEVRSYEVADMNEVKARFGMPRHAMSCHTAVIEGYAVEGHVPMEAFEALLAARPDIDGIALPGMPAGSPGMGGAQDAPFEVLALDDGATTAFGSY